MSERSGLCGKFGDLWWVVWSGLGVLAECQSNFVCLFVCLFVCFITLTMEDMLQLEFVAAGINCPGLKSSVAYNDGRDSVVVAIGKLCWLGADVWFWSFWKGEKIWSLRLWEKIIRCKIRSLGMRGRSALGGKFESLEMNGEEA